MDHPSSGPAPAAVPLVAWQDLCVDALDPTAQARFWATATGLRAVDDPEHTHLVGPTDAHRVWVNRVDRPHRVKNRVHLDVDVAADGGLDELVALGARVLRPAAETGWPWSVLADPEGNELCAFERPADEVPDYRLHGVVVDCADPFSLAAWWARLLGTEPVRHDEHGYASLERVAVDDRMTLDFVPVPEPRDPDEPNRVHWDVQGRHPDALEAVLDLGATRLWTTPRWEVLADPEGNEFCFFAAD